MLFFLEWEFLLLFSQVIPLNLGVVRNTLNLRGHKSLLESLYQK